MKRGKNILRNGLLIVIVSLMFLFSAASVNGAYGNLLYVYGDDDCENKYYSFELEIEDSNCKVYGKEDDWGDDRAEGYGSLGIIIPKNGKTGDFVTLTGDRHAICLINDVIIHPAYICDGTNWHSCTWKGTKVDIDGDKYVCTGTEEYGGDEWEELVCESCEDEYCYGELLDDGTQCGVEICDDGVDNDAVWGIDCMDFRCTFCWESICVYIADGCNPNKKNPEPIAGQADTFADYNKFVCEEKGEAGDIFNLHNGDYIADFADENPPNACCGDEEGDEAYVASTSETPPREFTCTEEEGNWEWVTCPHLKEELIIDPDATDVSDGCCGDDVGEGEDKDYTHPLTGVVCIEEGGDWAWMEADEIICNNQGYTWTGSECCGTVADKTYIDPSTGPLYNYYACWEGEGIANDVLVEDVDLVAMEAPAPCVTDANDNITGGTPCLCGTTECGINHYYCYPEEPICTVELVPPETPLCVTDATDYITGDTWPCSCGDTECVTEHNYCYSQSSTCTEHTICEIGIYNIITGGTPCSCGYTVCETTTEDYCYSQISDCTEYTICETSSNGFIIGGIPCLCGDQRTRCKIGEDHCYEADSECEEGGGDW